MDDDNNFCDVAGIKIEIKLSITSLNGYFYSE